MRETTIPRTAGVLLLALLLIASLFVTMAPAQAATTADAEFHFVNGEVLTGITGGGDFVIPDSFFINHYAPDAVPFALPITIHVSCSESFPGGWSGGATFPSATNPDHADWQIASYFITRTLGGGQIRECAETFVPASLTVVKQTNPVTTDAFSFSLVGDIPPLPGSQTPGSYDGGTQAVSGDGGSYTWNGLETGDYTLSELVGSNPAGYWFESFSCTNGVASDASPTASFRLFGGENVTCTFYNEAEVQLIPDVDIEKATNGFDADLPTGPEIVVGDAVTWTYVVTNTGETPLTGVTVSDDVLGEICVIGDLAVGDSDTCTATGVAVAGQYANLGTVTTNEGPSDEDPSHYFGLTPNVDIEKATNGFDADSPTGPWVIVGGAVDWTYVVTNTGEVPLTIVTVVDDMGVAVSCPQDTLAVGESMTCTASGVATIGQYANVGTVDTEEGVTDSDPSHYFGYIPEEPSVDIEKATNGFDADDPTGPSILVGDPVTWTYLVSNTGNIQLTGVTVTDNMGVAVSCPQDTLDVGESMECTASGVATIGQYANIGTVWTDQEETDSDPSHYIGYDVGSIGDFVWFDADKDGIQDIGEPGVAGVTVNLFEGRLCDSEPMATTTTDADGMYLFDNLIAGSYCVGFELPAEYTFTTADQGADDELDSDAPSAVVALAEGEDDLSVDAGLVGGDIVFEKETNVDTDTTFSFVFNGTQDVDLLSGESATFHMPGGSYTITELVVDGWELADIICDDEGAEVDGSSVTLFVPPGGSVGCTFLNEEIEAPLGLIGDLVWNDLDEDGIQDADEPGIAGVTVELLDAATDAVIIATTTDANGIYVLGNVPEGDYYLRFTGPVGWEFTKVDQGSDDAADSDAFFVSEIASAASTSGLAKANTQQVGHTTDFYMAPGALAPIWDAGMIFVEVSPQVVTTTTTIPPTTTTTVASTTVETLPFTGFGQGGIGGLGLVMIVMGGFVLMAVRRKDNGLEAVTEETPMVAWEG